MSIHIWKEWELRKMKDKITHVEIRHRGKIYSLSSPSTSNI